MPANNNMNQYARNLLSKNKNKNKKTKNQGLGVFIKYDTLYNSKRLAELQRESKRNKLF